MAAGARPPTRPSGTWSRPSAMPRLALSRFEQGPTTTAGAHACAACRPGPSARGAGLRHIGYVSGRLLEFAEEREVGAVIVARLARSDVLEQSPVLAQHLWLSDRYDVALRLLDAMRRRVPAHPLLALTRANVLRYLGGMRGHRALRALPCPVAGTRPTRTGRWHAPVRARRGRARARLQPRAGRCRRLAGTGPPALCAVQANWTTRRHRGRLGCAGAGAAMMRAHRVRCARAKHETLEDMMRESPATARGAATGRSSVPVFIVGMPRTGTTLLDRILGNHPPGRFAGRAQRLRRGRSAKRPSASTMRLGRAGVTKLRNGTAEVGAAIPAADRPRHTG